MMNSLWNARSTVCKVLIGIFVNISNICLLYRLSCDSIRISSSIMFCVDIIQASPSRAEYILFVHSDLYLFEFSVGHPLQSSAHTITTIALSSNIQFRFIFPDLSANPIEESSSLTLAPSQSLLQGELFAEEAAGEVVVEEKEVEHKRVL
jgi:hypothetical protein